MTGKDTFNIEEIATLEVHGTWVYWTGFAIWSASTTMTATRTVAPPGCLADYEFYSEAFGGGLSEAAFYDCLPKSLKHVQWICGYREPQGCQERQRYKRAICAAVEAFADYGDGAIGFTLGNFKTNVRDGVSFSAEDKATQAALRELGGSGLGFCGVWR